MFNTRSDRQRPYPGLTAEILSEMAAAEQDGDSAIATGGSSGSLSRSEGFMAHLITYLVGIWNLIIINLSHSPDRLWFWPWVGGWGAVLLLHLTVILVLSRRRRHSRFARTHS